MVRPMIFMGTIALLASIGIAARAADQSKAAEKNITVAKFKQPMSLSWLPPLEQAQQQVFKYLKDKVGEQVVTPQYPKSSLILWTRERYQAAGNDVKLLYSTIYGDLLIAQRLLQQKDISQQRQGLWVADNVNFYADVKLKDTWLRARIYEGFLLPSLPAAHIEAWRGLGREAILRGAAGAYLIAGETDKQILVLQSLLPIVNNPNKADQIRAQLAQALATQKNYAEAIGNLKAITDPGLNALKRLIPEYEKLNQQHENEQKKIPLQTAPK